MAVLHKAHGLSYVAGAPRHKQQGAVFELQKVGRETNNFMPVLEGEQPILIFIFAIQLFSLFIVQV